MGTQDLRDSITVQQLKEDQVDDADRIFRLAFGTFMGMENPEGNFPDVNLVRTRYRTSPDSFFGAENEGKLLGSNYVTNWGSVGFFGPLTVHPEHWDSGVGSRLMEPVVEKLDQWDAKVAGLFTFPHSPKHHGLYQKFGFWPQYLTALMGKPAQATGPDGGWSLLSRMPEGERGGVTKEIDELTDSVYDGLNVSIEVNALEDQGVGDTVLIWDGDRLGAVAVCHCGRGSETTSDSLYVKFAAVRPGPNAQENFDRVLRACESLAADKGLEMVKAGVNTGRHEAYRRLGELGYRSAMIGVSMHRPNDPGYDRPGLYVLDDMS